MPSALADALLSDAGLGRELLAERFPGESAPGSPRPPSPHSLVLVLADPIRVPGVGAGAEAWQPLLLPGELAGQAAASALPSPNGANAPPDNPENADTLPARALRPDLPARSGEPDATAAEAQDAELPAPSGGPALAEDARETPGMSQPGSVIAHLPWRSASQFAILLQVRCYR
jgi:hypothetical protein